MQISAAIILEDPVSGDGKDAYTPVPVKVQKGALEYFKEQVFTMPEWLFNKELLKKTFPVKDTPVGPMEYAPLNLRREYQYGLLYSLLNESRLLRMLEMEVMFGKDKVFTVSELFNDIRPAIFAQTLKGKSLSITDRMLQQNYVDALLVSTDKMLEKITKKSIQQNGLNNLPQICAI
ncbi:zinc-dependent metalloprotease [Pedobacter sp. NJ-S-72]